MSMTHEEAARILDPETSAKALREYGGANEQIAAYDEACRIAADVLRNKPTREPLTLEQLRRMDGQPVWIVEQPDWGHWELSEDAEDYLCDRDTGLYGLTYPDPDGKRWLNQLGWIAYAYPPAHIGRGIWVNASERMPEDGQIVLVTASGKPQSNITLEYAYELAEWSIEEGWILNCWPEWEGAKVTHWMPLPEQRIQLEVKADEADPV